MRKLTSILTIICLVATLITAVVPAAAEGQDLAEDALKLWYRFTSYTQTDEGKIVRNRVKPGLSDGIIMGNADIVDMSEEYEAPNLGTTLWVPGNGGLKIKEGFQTAITGSWTVSVWFYLPDTPREGTRLFDFGSTTQRAYPTSENSDPPRNSIFFKLKPLQLSDRIYGSSNIFSLEGKGLSLLVYQHQMLTVTFDKATNTYAVYHNGNLITSGNTNGQMRSLSEVDFTKAFLGTNVWYDTSFATDNPDLVGGYYDFKIYATALNADQVKAIYDLGKEYGPEEQDRSEDARRALDELTIPSELAERYQFPTFVGSIEDPFPIVWLVDDEYKQYINFATGRIIEPKGEDVTFTLTAKIDTDQYDVRKEFTVTIKGNKENLPDDVLAYYDFSEAVDGYVLDKSRNNFNAQVFGDVEFKNGRAKLNGDGQYFVADKELLNNVESFSVYAKVYIPKNADNTGARIFDFGTHQRNSWFLKAGPVTAGSKFNFGDTYLVPSASNVNLKRGAINELVVTFEKIEEDKVLTSVYLDGVLIGQNTNIKKTPKESTETNFVNYIGRTQWLANDEYPGENPDIIAEYDEFVVYNRALTQDEVREMCNAANETYVKSIETTTDESGNPYVTVVVNVSAQDAGKTVKPFIAYYTAPTRDNTTRIVTSSTLLKIERGGYDVPLFEGENTFVLPYDATLASRAKKLFLWSDDKDLSSPVVSVIPF